MKFAGIDTGFSRERRSTGLCALSVEGGRVGWQLRNTGSTENERERDLRDLFEGGPILTAAAIDGPLSPHEPDRQRINRYRLVEALLSRGDFQTRAKPGNTNSPSGQDLHDHATRLRALTREIDRDILTRANHVDRIPNLVVTEAFPTAFAAVLLEGGEVDAIASRLKRRKFDGYWEAAAIASDKLLDLVEDVAFRRPLAQAEKARLREDLRRISNHDHRAAFLCALTALCVARNRFLSVGDRLDGAIAMPPLNHWATWGRDALAGNVRSVQDDRRNFAGRHVQIVSNGRAITPAAIRAR